MYLGKFVEVGPAREVIERPLHPYTRALVSAVPDMHTDLDAPLATIPGRAPDPSQVPAGCAFAPRCPLADDRCRTSDPELVTDGNRRVACWHAGEPIGPMSITLVKAAHE